MSSLILKPKLRDYEIDKLKYENKFVQSSENPLVKLDYVSNQAKEIEKKKGRSKKYMDPLSQISVKQQDKSKVINTTKIDTEVKQSVNNQLSKQDDIKNEQIFNKSYSFILGTDENFNNEQSVEQSWENLKKNLIEVFCKNDNLIIKSLIEVSMDEEEDILKKDYKIDKGRTRLEELESENGKYSVSTSSEYLAKLDVLKREMFVKWESEDKVSAIKIMIHCTKILNDVSTPKFYCQKFLRIVEILECFSSLVFERIYKLAFQSQGNLQNDNDKKQIKNILKYYKLLKSI